VSKITADCRIDGAPERVKLFSFDLVLGADASGAEVKLFGFAFNHHRRGMNIGFEAAVGMPLGMADVLTEHRCFPTNITLQGVCSLRIINPALQTSVQ
jgi:hypothetical protein